MIVGVGGGVTNNHIVNFLKDLHKSPLQVQKYGKLASNDSKYAVHT